MRVMLGVEGEQRWAWTEGLTRLGQRDMAVPLAWQEGDWRDRQITRLLTFIGDYVSGQPKRILAGQTMRYGWTGLRFRESTLNDGDRNLERLIIQEIAEPMQASEPNYVDGAMQAITVLAIQGKAAIRNNIRQECEHPNYSDFAIVCNRVSPEGGSAVFMMRQAREDDEPVPHDSRWFIGCTDRQHDHSNSSNLGKVHLVHVVEHYPQVFPYLAFPDGSAVVFENDEIIAFHPDESEGYRDILDDSAESSNEIKQQKSPLGFVPRDSQTE